jgi:hypothetical protein
MLLGLPNPFFAVDSRDYQITEPDESRLNAMQATILCLEKPRPHVPLDRAVMAIRFSDEIVGTQFHPEADDEGMLRYFLSDEKRNQVITNFGQQKYDEMVAYLQDPDKIALDRIGGAARFFAPGHAAATHWAPCSPVITNQRTTS